VLSHPSEDEIGRFLTSRLDPANEQRVARHLLAGCGVCSRELVSQAPERLLGQADERRRRQIGPLSSRDRALVAALQQEARWGADEKKLARSLALLREDPRGGDGPSSRPLGTLRGRFRVEALLQRSFELRFRDPRAMLWLSYNALQAAESLPPEECSVLLRFDLRARAWAELANAYRINDALAEAAGAFERARAALRQGSGDPWLLAHLSGLEASFLVDQRRLNEAGKQLDRIYQLYRKLGDRHLAGRALISMGVCSQHQGKSQRAFEILRKGLPLLDPARDPELRPAAQQCLISSLMACGHYTEAGELLLRSGLRQAFSRDPLNLIRIRWTEGRLMAGLDRLPRAGATLMGTRADFLDLGLGYEAALVGHDLIPVLLRQGRSGEARRVARESYSTLHDLGIRQETVKFQRYLS
jgi:tetratricopeptide (TPR) repeat protein